MEVEIRNRPSFANLRVQLGAGDTIIAESDAMASMSSTVEMSTSFNGGFFGGMARKLFGSESLFVNHFTTKTAGELVLTQAFPGDIRCVDLGSSTLFLQPGAFVACEPTVKFGVGWAGLASFIGREGLFRLKVSGPGRIWFGAYGGIFDREIGEEYVVDTGHLVAYEPSLELRVGMSGGIFSTLFGGEGLVTRLRGPGRVYLQSRSFGGLVDWTNQHLF